MTVLLVIYGVLFISFFFFGYVDINGRRCRKKDCGIIKWLVSDIFFSILATLILGLPILGVLYLIQ